MISSSITLIRMTLSQGTILAKYGIPFHIFDVDNDISAGMAPL